MEPSDFVHDHEILKILISYLQFVLLPGTLLTRLPSTVQIGLLSCVFTLTRLLCFCFGKLRVFIIVNDLNNVLSFALV